MFKTVLNKNFLSIIAIFTSCYLLFSMPHAVGTGIKSGLSICFYTILPSLFPFMVLSSYIIKSDVLLPLYNALAPITRFLFKQNNCSVSVIFMGLIGGFPVGTKMTALLYENGRITKNQAQRLCMFCVNGGPAFVITAVGVGMLGSSKAGVIMFISLCLSSIILGIISRFFDDKGDIKSSNKNYAQSPLLALSSSVSDNVNATLSICAWVILFSALTECFRQINLDEPVFTALVSFLEVTQGCTQTAKSFSLPVITAIIGFGGFCVHCQVYAFIRATELKYIRFFTGRVINGALAALICYLLLMIFPVSIETSMQNVAEVMPFSVSIPAFLAIIVMCVIMIFDIDSKRKV